MDDYWNKNYYQIDTISNKIKVLEENGLIPLAHFVLPEYCWMEKYYLPNELRFCSFLEKYNHNKDVRNFVELEKEEIEFYKKYKSYFSYAFYLARKL